VTTQKTAGAGDENFGSITFCVGNRIQGHPR
jgi:hypothetical protein